MTFRVQYSHCGLYYGFYDLKSKKRPPGIRMSLYGYYDQYGLPWHQV